MTDLNMPPPFAARSPAGRFPRLLTAAYLEETTTVRVRFNEVDAMGVVWHGHYVNYFEEARRAFGRRYDLDYPVFFAHNIPAPVVQLRVEYLASARMDDLLDVTARLYQSDAARLDFEYEARRASDNTLLATGATLQVFTTPAGELLLAWPDFMRARLQSWESLWKTPPSPGDSPLATRHSENEMH